MKIHWLTKVFERIYFILIWNVIHLLFSFLMFLLHHLYKSEQLVDTCWNKF